MNESEFEALRDWLLAEGGFVAVRLLPDGSVAGVVRLMTTTAICLGVTRQCAYERRFCFRNADLAYQRFGELQSEDDTPAGWTARRPELPEDHAAKQRPGYVGGDPALPSSWGRAA
jgi:hypothetical protein